uniref:Cytochrome P450 n=1 Tax=Graphocephala atropunctata TaxID=36148 RepID=A0A1B6L4Y4_9HEMI
MGFIIENNILEIFYASLLIFWIIYLYFAKNYSYWEERSVPHIPSVFPFGSIKDIILRKSFSGIVFDGIYKQFQEERYVGYIDIRTPALLIRDPELIKLILQKDFDHFTDHYEFNEYPKQHMTRNLFTKKGNEWRHMRVKLSSAYTAAKVRMMFSVVKKSSDTLRKVVDQYTHDSCIVDLKDFLSRFTVDVIASCAFGIEINSLVDKESKFYRLGLESTQVKFSSLLKKFISCSFPICFKIHVFNIIDPKICDYFTGVIRSAVEYREEHNISKYDFLDLLIKLRQNQSILDKGENPGNLEDVAFPGKKEGLTIEEIAAETFLFFRAGYDSTANTIMFCLYELACNSKIQEKLHQEVEEVLDRHKDAISYQALQEMTYMDQVVSETLRRYPTFPFLSRRCTENYNVPKSSLVIRKGNHITIPLYSLHHDPLHFPDPFTFNPDRFSPENCKERHPYVYIPFGEGPRMCIGQKFGLINVKTAVATLALDYQFSLTPDTDYPLKLTNNACTTVPSKPLKLVFTRRRAKT